MKVNFDPTINLGHIGTALVFCGGLIASYYDLKGDLANLVTRVESKWEYQRLVDTNQDSAISDVKNTVKESTEDIKREIRTIKRN